MVQKGKKKHLLPYFTFFVAFLSFFNFKAPYGIAFWRSQLRHDDLIIHAKC